MRAKSKRCLAIRHLPFEDLGFFEDVLRKHGFDVNYLEAPQAGPREIDNADADLLVVLGGPLSANDERDYPFIASELALLDRRLAKARPTLGICLGGQLMARALGARVAPAQRGEIGWIPLALTDHGKRSSLRHFASSPVFHWHGDAFELPASAQSLASTPDCDHQAFALGANVLGLQFHPEVTAPGLETWYVGHYRALESSNAPDVRELREASARYSEDLRERGTQFLDEWLRALQ